MHPPLCKVTIGAVVVVDAVAAVDVDIDAVLLLLYLFSLYLDRVLRL